MSAAGDDNENRAQGRFADSEFCEKVRKVSAEEAAEFMEIKKTTSFKIAFAVFLCIISPVVLIGMAGLSEEGLISLSEDKAALMGCAVLLVLVAAAVAIFIYCGMQTKSFDFLEKEPISVDSSTLQKVRAKNRRMSLLTECVLLWGSPCSFCRRCQSLPQASSERKIIIIYWEHAYF